MNLRIFESEIELDWEAAKALQFEIKNKPNLKLGLATGMSPVGLYRELVNLYNAGELSFRDVTSYNLDEYVGLDREHPYSFFQFMNQHLFKHIDLDEERIHIPNGCVEDVEKEVKRYNSLLGQEGQLDVQILGIGLNGHIGFNEPGETLSADTHIVTLSEHTRKVNSKYFNTLEEVPKKAITMGIGNILRAKKIIFIAKGEEKSEIVRQAFKGPVDPNCPGTFLQLHGNVDVFLDLGAAKGLA